MQNRGRSPSRERAQARCTEAIATSGDRTPVLVERLRTTEAKRRALTAQLDRVSTKGSARPAWRDIERRLRARLKDWRTVPTGDDVANTRQGIRELLTTAIRFTPF